MLFFRFFLLFVAFVAVACTNNPYPERDASKKVLYLDFQDAPRTLDPAVAYTTSAHAITGKVYDTLLEYHYLKRPYELIPGQATRVPEATERADGRVAYRFRIRQGLLFQEDPCFELGGQGRKTREITAEDFVFQLKRIADPQVNSPIIEPFYNVWGFKEYSEQLEKLAEKEPGFPRLPPKERYERAGDIRGIQIVGPHTFDVILEQPYPQILYWFAMPFTTPVAWEAVHYYTGTEGRPHFADHPVGSGPFRLTLYDKQLRMVLEKNPNWYGVRHPEWKAPAAIYPTEGTEEDERAGRMDVRHAGEPLPFIDRIEYRREKERIPAFSKFLQGYYDASAVIRESFDQIVLEDRLSPEMADKGMKLEKTVDPAIYYIGFNMQDPVVGAPGGEKSRYLRQAMSLAVDVKEYSRLFMNGRGLPADFIIPPGIFGHEETYDNPYRRLNLERASELLAKAGYERGIDPKTGEPLHLTFDVGSTSQDALLRYKFWVNSWRKIGLDVEVAATTYNKFQEKVRQGAYQVFTWGWVADYPDPENFLFLLWSKMARSINGGPNTANFQHDRYDELFLQMKTMKNGPERLRIIREMREILERERPWIELFFPESYVLYHGWVENVKPAGLSIATQKYFDLDPEKRARLREKWNEPIVWPAYALLGLFLLIVIPGIRTFFRERQ